MIITGSFELKTNERTDKVVLERMTLTCPKECNDLIAIVKAIKKTMLANSKEASAAAATSRVT